MSDDEADIDEQMRNLGRVLAVLEEHNVEVEREGIDIQNTNPAYTDVELTCRLYHGRDSEDDYPNCDECGDGGGGLCPNCKDSTMVTEK